jgi:micrococcal nuclease
MKDLSLVREDDCTECLPVREKQVVKCVRIIDGDTIIIAFYRDEALLKMSCRIRGIDTPEMRSKILKEKELALLAKHRLAAAAEGKMALLTEVGIDKYGRCLATVTVDGLDLTNHMLKDPTVCHPYDGGTKSTWQC